MAAETRRRYAWADRVAVTRTTAWWLIRVWWLALTARHKDGAP